MNLKDAVNDAMKVTPKAAALLGASAMVFDKLRSQNLQDKNKTPSPTNNDKFSLSSFTARIKDDGFRLTKGYYYNVIMYVTDESGIQDMLTFHCKEATLPGWRAKTQTSRIYGLDYEITTDLIQDPIWLTFSVDIKHKIEAYLLSKRKLMTFDSNSYSPEYKSKYKFDMVIEVTDENFEPQYNYVFTEAFIKSVLNISYGSSANEFKEVKAEVVYEEAFAVDRLNPRAVASPNPEAVNKNMLQVGPFKADISLVNQVKDTIGKVPQWFTGNTKV